MKRWLPRTMLGLRASAWWLSVLPLVVGLLIAQGLLYQLDVETERLLEEGLASMQSVHALRENLVAMERIVEGHMARPQDALAAGFEERLGRSLAQVQALPGSMSSESAPALEQGLLQLQDHWRHGTDEALQAVLARLAVLTDQLDRQIRLGQQGLDDQISALLEQGQQVRLGAGLALLILVPLSGALAWWLSRWINRPLHQARRAIEAMSIGQYEQPIHLAYPAELTALGEELDWLRQRLAELEQDQDRLLRNVSHELKTPLTSLIQGLDLLGKDSMGPLNVKQQEVIEILGESAQELEQMIANLIAYARWQSERQGTEMDWFDVRPMVEEVLAPRRLLLASHGLEVRTELCDEPIYGDRARLKEALDNLVGNAIKYTKRGTGIEIWMRVGDKLQIMAVRDYGRGVPLKDHRRIFDPFIRGAESEESAIRGTGVGLTIVRETAHAHAGRVEVQNANPGARFIMQWPLAAPRAQAA